MEWIGFIALIGVGLWLGVGGLALCWFSAAISGRVGAGVFIPVAGAVVLFLAFKFAPFTIVIN